MMQVLQNDTILRDYKILQLLGAGACGVVYKAEHIFTRKIYALKHSRNVLPDEVELMEYMKTINLKNIVNIIDSWHITYNTQPLNGQPLGLFLVMDYCSGGDLYQQNSKKLSQEKIDVYVLQLLQAVDQMHSHYLIHRDIKPENIVFDGETLKLCDFGLSKKNDQGVGQTKQIGTPYYMAPELISVNLANFDYNNTIDCWAVGCIIYELYTQEPLFSGYTIPEVYVKIKNFQVAKNWEKQLGAIKNEKHLKIVQSFIQPADQRKSAKEALRLVSIVKQNEILLIQDIQQPGFNLMQSKLHHQQIIKANKTDPAVLRVNLKSLISAKNDPNHPNSVLVKNCVANAEKEISLKKKQEAIIDTVIDFLKKELKQI